MTEKEAIIIIKPLLASSIDTSAGFEKRPIVFAFDMAIKALEKQIPKKPNYGMAQGSRWRSCPACCARVLNTYKFCDQCGQKLDWGGEK